MCIAARPIFFVSHCGHVTPSSAHPRLATRDDITGRMFFLTLIQPKLHTPAELASRFYFDHPIHCNVHRFLVDQHQYPAGQ
jgi:hypothetical protein